MQRFWWQRVMLGGLLALWMFLGASAHALTSQNLQVLIASSRPGLSEGTSIRVSVSGRAEGSDIAQGRGRLDHDISPGQTGRITVRLNQVVDSANVQRFRMTLTPPGRQTARISHVSIRLGDRYPAQLMVNGLQSPHWNGAARDFDVAPLSEADVELRAISITGRVVDGVAYSNSVEMWVECTDGRMWTFPISANLRNSGTFSFFQTLPRPVKRSEIKHVYLYSGRASTFKVTSFYQLFEETDDVLLQDVLITGENNGAHHPIRVLPRVELRNHHIFRSPNLSNGAPTVITPYRPNWFNVYVFTGDDDLRWNPDVQPNMEIKINLYVRGNPSPIPIVSRSLAPYAPFANGGVWGGSFNGYDIAERIAPWRNEGQPPRVQDIEAIEVETVLGWDGSTPTRRVIRGSGDPFRQPDTWSFRGIWVGVAPELPHLAAEDRQALAPWHTIVCDFSRVRKLQEGQKIRFPVEVSSIRPRL